MLSRLLGRNKNEPKAPAEKAVPAPEIIELKWENRPPEARYLGYNVGPDGITGGAQEVVGVKYYRENLERLCAGHSGSLDIRTEALLVPEADNPHDPNAVRVDVVGLTVGHLPKEDAVAFRKRHRKTIAAQTPIMCAARVRKKIGTSQVFYYVHLETDLE